MPDLDQIEVKLDPALRPAYRWIKGTNLLSRIGPELEVLARRLISDPRAERLKAPSYRGSRKKKTGELINEPLF